VGITDRAVAGRPALIHKGYVMTRNRTFRPGHDARLEDRVVLSHAAAHAPAVLVRGLASQAQTPQISAQAQTVAAQVNTAFDSFNTEFDQARALFFATATAQTTAGGGMVAPMSSISAFSAYTNERVQLLDQELVTTVLQAPLSKASARSISNQVSAKLVSTKASSNSLLSSLNTTIPQSLTPGPLTTLYSLAEDSAIETARLSILNIVDNTRYVTPPHKH
jgi:outer membrane murein-binding lipoprotein Lpp